MMKAKNVLIELTNGEVKTVHTRWRKSDEEKLQTIFGVSMEKEIYSMLFQEISNFLERSNIGMSEIKCIRFEEVTN
jgi:pantothenate kinase-related protein Tda10